MTDDELTDEILNAAMLRSEKAVCPPGDRRCYGFPYDLASAVQSRTPAGWCLIGWVCANSARRTWDAWYNLTTGEGRLRKQESRLKQHN